MLLQGGVYVFDGSRLLYARKDESTGDHSKIDDILKSCCTPVAAWTGNLRYVPACNTVVDMQIRCELKLWCRSVPYGAICWSWKMTTLMQQYLFTDYWLKFDPGGLCWPYLRYSDAWRKHTTEELGVGFQNAGLQWTNSAFNTSAVVYNTIRFFDNS